MSGVVTIVLFGVGVVLGRSDEPAVARGQTFAWLLTVAAIWLTAFIASREWIVNDDQDAFVLGSITALVAAVALWASRRSVLQMVAFAVTTAAATIALISRVDDVEDWVFGLAFLALGSVWVILTWVGWFEPRRTSYALGAVGMLLVAFPEGGEMPWPLLGLAAGLALMGLSVALGETVLLGLGVAGLFIYIPMTIFELFGESLGVPVALLITGLVLLGVVVVTVRLRSSPR